MAQSISNYHNLSIHLDLVPRTLAEYEASKKLTPSKKESYEGTKWTNAPSIWNIVYAPYEIVIATGALMKAVATGDKEGRLDASIRLTQQPLSFLGAMGTIAVTVTEWLCYLKLIKAQSFITPLNMVASGLGLGLCAIELLFESLGLKRALNFRSEFQFGAAPEMPDLLTPAAPNELKEKLVNWIQHFLAHPEQLQKALGEDAYPIAVQRLNQLLTNLNTSESTFTDPDVRLQTRQFLNQLKEDLMLSDLGTLQHKYFVLSPNKLASIDALIQHKFPELSGRALNEKKEELASLELERKSNDLARRVQPWFAEELDEKLEPLIAKFSNPDPSVRNQARFEAEELLVLMDIQAKKKLAAHIIGLIGIAILSAGLIAGLVACPILIPLVLISVGGTITLIRYHFSLGFWNTKGWRFEIVNCIPEMTKWIYYKIISIGKGQETAKSTPHVEYPFRERQVFQLTDVSYYLPTRREPQFRLNPEAINAFLLR